MWFVILVWLIAAFLDGNLGKVILGASGVIFLMWVAATLHIGFFTVLGLVVIIFGMSEEPVCRPEERRFDRGKRLFKELGAGILFLLACVLLDLGMSLI